MADAPNTIVATTTEIVAQGSVAAVKLLATVSAAIVPVHHDEKPEKFNGLNFKRWQQKMLFYLMTLNFVRFLTEEPLKLSKGEIDMQVVNDVDVWKHSNFLCRNYVMNRLHDSLYNVYCAIETTKKLWESLDRKYKIKDVGAKKFVIDRFLDFKMVDSRTVISKVQEIQVILHEIQADRKSVV